MNIVLDVEEIRNTTRLSEYEREAICQEVKALIDNGMATIRAKSTVANKYNISISSISNWDRKYGFFTTPYLTDDMRKAICEEVQKLTFSGLTKKEAERILGNKYHISPETIRKWDLNFREFSAEKKEFTNDEKIAICKEVKMIIDAGEKAEDAKKIVAEKFNIHPSTIQLWDMELRIFSKNHKTEEMKIQICQEVKALIQSGKKSKEACRIISEKYNLYPSTIRTWDLKFRIFSGRGR